MERVSITARRDQHHGQVSKSLHSLSIAVSNEIGLVLYVTELLHPPFSFRVVRNNRQYNSNTTSRVLMMVLMNH
jgi:hypothetical protein